MATAQPTSPAGVVDAIVRRLPATERVRLLIDGAPAARPDELAEAVVTALSPRPSLHVRAELFWQPASLRFENGRQDIDAWQYRWLDERTLQREVLQSFWHDGRVLPGLRDPITDRSLRLAAVVMPPSGVLVVSGNALAWARTRCRPVRAHPPDGGGPASAHPDVGALAAARPGAVRGDRVPRHRCRPGGPGRRPPPPGPAVGSRRTLTAG